MKLLFQFIILLTAMNSLQIIGQTTDSFDVKPAGKLVNVGGYNLHIICTRSGKPAVILISGSAAFSFDWTLVQEKLSKYSQICSYDRPGLAWSDPGPAPRSLSQDVYELHNLLEAAGIKPPYIMAGHSLGGIIARKFAKEYPDEVSGIVLIDATSENAILNVKGKIERVRLSASAEKKIAPPKEKVDSLTKVPSMEEIKELWSMIGEPGISSPYNMLPEHIQKVRLWAQSLPKYYIADNYEFLPEEFSQMYSDSLSYKLGNKPLIVICSVKNEYPEELGKNVTDSLMTDKIQNQYKLSELSNITKLIETKKSGHEIHLSEPELVVDAILQVINSVKTNH